MPVFSLRGFKQGIAVVAGLRFTSVAKANNSFITGLTGLSYQVTGVTASRESVV